ncbi:hypothetical protein HOA55_00835 [archaeon]|jgi:hypothetical protein|nr:hypothetical protein [archaeon]MBT3578199.1 hypothetical protein [archaeon]MBT6819880.1 hypothetical protein [archaeon]MBT6956382.1 hypothetical protein [archaeon]MBT7025662.1 hypothetical protein [archaeon]
MERGLNKRAQQTMSMPFGLIFAIFLIVVFIVIAFIAVNSFLDIGQASNVGMFYDELQDAVDEAWRSQTSEFDFEIDLPSGIERVCFANLSASITGPQTDYNAIKNYDVYEANTFLVPPEKAEHMEWKLIKHINISKTTENRNPYCIDISRDMKIKKDFYDKLVVIE